MIQTDLTADNTVFILLSFEGPDPYSSVGGLGVRVSNLSQTLAGSGFLTHLFFLGDPTRKSEELSIGAKLVLHRWCQWISEFYPDGVYQGENEKLQDFNESITRFVVEQIVKPAIKQDKLVVILGEEWHTAEAMCRISDQLQSNGLRDRVVMFWNANNTFGFNRINWRSLADRTTITTVSRYMKHIMRGTGVNPLVIPNGIPRSLLNAADTNRSTRLTKNLNAGLVLTKVARWDPAKRWHTAVEATVRLKARGMRAVLIARGGMEPHGEEVMHSARALGLRVRETRSSGSSWKDYLEATRNDGRADILNIKFHCPPEFLQVVYRASDAVLANSSHEPFGLVGLEAMAAGGVAFTGGTGEDYAIHFHNCVVLETSDPKEIEAYVTYLDGRTEEKDRIRLAGRRTARRYIWEEVIKNLVEKLEYQARVQGLLATPTRTRTSDRQPQTIPGKTPQGMTVPEGRALEPIMETS